MRIGVFVIGVFISFTTSAQFNLYGTWVLRSKQHILGPEYPNALTQEMTFREIKDSLVIETNTAFGANVVILPMNGGSIIGTSPSGRKYVKRLEWDEKRGLAITTVFSLQEIDDEVDFTRIEAFSLSPDGEQLNFYKKSIETRSENWEVKAVYKKK